MAVAIYKDGLPGPVATVEHTDDVLTAMKAFAESRAYAPGDQSPASSQDQFNIVSPGKAVVGMYEGHTYTGAVIEEIHATA